MPRAASARAAGEPTDRFADGPRPVGRPRVPDVEERVFAAAIALYERDGWAGFSFDAVAARAGVGKSAIYRRWSSKEELLGEALMARTEEVTNVDTGSLHGDLVQLARQLLANYTAPHGLVSLRLFVDALHNADLARRSRDRVARHSRDTAAIVRRAVARGELDARRAALLLPALHGSVLHLVITSTDLDSLRRARQRHAERIVEFVLRAASA